MQYGETVSVYKKKCDSLNLKNSYLEKCNSDLLQEMAQMKMQSSRGPPHNYHRRF